MPSFRIITQVSANLIQNVPEPHQNLRILPVFELVDLGTPKFDTLIAKGPPRVSQGPPVKPQGSILMYLGAVLALQSLTSSL